MKSYRDKFNLMKLTVLSYTLTCVTGIAVVLPFVIKQSAASYFNSPIGYIGFVFSFFMFGMLIGEYLNGFIVKLIKLKSELYIVSVIYVLCVIGMYFTNSAYLMIPILLIVGFCFGLVVTIPNFIIVHAFSGTVRSTKLNRIDFFFSVGSFVYPMVAAWMLFRNFSWQAVYLSVIIFFIFLVIMCLITVFPDMNDTEDSVHVNAKFSKWNIGVYLVGFSIFFYFMSYVGFTYWVTDYLIHYLHIDAQSANFGVTLFWVFYAIGCFISSFAVKFIKINKYITISAIVSFICYFLIAYSPNATLMLIFISILGLGCATVYSSSISYGSMLVEYPSPRIISFFITASGVGTWLGEVYSSYIQTHFGVPAIIYISAAFMLIVIVVMLITSKISITHTGGDAPLH
ncbi:MAG: MFS transporter TsgA [bacterium]|nr:MFS transporter TsgA [bacterium]